jgi:hypothetical protein
MVCHEPVRCLARRLAVAHGHSTPQMAGQIARHAEAKRLVMTHFGPKYPGDDSAHARRIMGEVRSLAREQFDGEVRAARAVLCCARRPVLRACVARPALSCAGRRRQVIAARDFMRLELHHDGVFDVSQCETSDELLGVPDEEGADTDGPAPPPPPSRVDAARRDARRRLPADDLPSPLPSRRPPAPRRPRPRAKPAHLPFPGE